MARKRYVTSEISSDPELAMVASESPQAALMWPWLLTALDDWGRMYGNPGKIRLTVFQAFPFTADGVNDALTLYHKVSLIHWYTVNGQSYIQVNPRSFYALNSYIQKDRQRRDASKFPPPYHHPWGKYWSETDWDPASSAESFPIYMQQEAATSAEMSQKGEGGSSLSSPFSSLSDPFSSVQKDQCVKTRPKEPANRRPHEYSEAFGRFWAAYPRRVEKVKAWRKWLEVLKTGAKEGGKEDVKEEDLIAAAAGYAVRMVREGTHQKFIKHPATFLGPDKPYEEYMPRAPDADAPQDLEAGWLPRF